MLWLYSLTVSVSALQVLLVFAFSGFTQKTSIGYTKRNASQAGPYENAGKILF
jgi:hypothetical protein